jgi:hypothetical protein
MRFLPISVKTWLKATISVALLALLFPLSNCQKESFTTNTEDKIEFSTDTLRFDTVFTELGSATRILKIYNPHKKSIRVTKIYLEKGAQSRFNLNVDGLPGDEHLNLEIAPNDSMYVFVEVTVNPNAPLSSSPFVLAENLLFETNGNLQTVVLEAWGQNAVYLPSRFSAGNVNGYGCDGGEWIWDDPKPYVIYGVLVINNCTVRIPAGARIYVHGGLAKSIDPDTGEKFRYNDGFLAFVGNGKLVIEGTKEKPVIFEDDRLEPEFDEEAGQWTGIWLQAGTTGHNIDHCIIRNSIIGVRVDSAANLNIRNTQIYNTAGSGLIGVHANIRADNCLFYSNVGYAIQLEYGGDYVFNYCTAASYGVDGEALRMGNALCLDEGCEQYVAFPLRARFNNCILFGNRADQINLFDRVNDPLQFNYKLANCIVRVKDLIKDNAFPDFFNQCDPCLNLASQDTIFLDPNAYEYRLDTLHSKANKYGRPISGITQDLDGKTRDPEKPDVGCFEIEF